VLGLLKHQAARAERLSLRPGDKLALYTDGVTEAADAAGAEFGTERLMVALRSDGVSSLQELHSHVLSDVRAYTSGKLADDATLVLISVRGVAAAHALSPNNRAWSQTEN
jgi:phosphoserine phosphatase RsbU/P